MSTDSRSRRLLAVAWQQDLAGRQCLDELSDALLVETADTAKVESTQVANAGNGADLLVRVGDRNRHGGRYDAQIGRRVQLPIQTVVAWVPPNAPAM